MKRSYFPYHLIKIGQSLFDEGGPALMQEIAKKVAAHPNGRYLAGVWDRIGHKKTA